MPWRQVLTCNHEGSASNTTKLSQVDAPWIQSQNTAHLFYRPRTRYSTQRICTNLVAGVSPGIGIHHCYTRLHHVSVCVTCLSTDKWYDAFGFKQARVTLEISAKNAKKHHRCMHKSNKGIQPRSNAHQMIPPPDMCKRNGHVPAYHFVCT